MAFPSSPTIGQEYDESGVRFYWDGTVWRVKGHVGPIGPPGQVGVQGIQGVQGRQGLQGIQGIQGLQGIQGRQGLQGIQGIQGTQGIQGIQGLQGIQGFQGLQGQNGTGVGDMLKSENLSGLANYTTARSNLGLGSAATANTGTSGATIPLLSAANTWSSGQTFTNANINLSGTSKLLIGSQTAVRLWNTTDVDIDGVVPGVSGLGHIVEGPLNGHLVMGLRSNDTTDGFHIIDNANNGTNTYSRLLFTLTPTTLQYLGANIVYSGITSDVGLGTSTPVSPLNILKYQTSTAGSTILYNSFNEMYVNAASASATTFIGDRTTLETVAANASDYSATLIALAPRIFHNGTGIVTAARGVNLVARNASSGTITTGIAGNFELYNDTTGTVTTGYAGKFLINAANTLGTMGTVYGLHVDILKGTSHTITTSYGLFINSSPGTTAYGVYVGATAANYFAGNVGIGVVVPTAKLDVTGDIKYSSQLLAPSGSAAAPSISFTGDTNVGIYRSAADTMNFVTGGVSRFFIDSAGVTNFEGAIKLTTGNPLILDTAAGIQRLAIFKTAGLNRWAVGVDSNAESGSDVGSNIVFYNYNDAGTFVSTPLTIARNTGVASFSASIRTGNGTAGSPAYTFSSDTNTGFYSGGGDVMSLSVGGANRWNWNTAAMYSGAGTGAAAILNAVGSATTPSYYFVGDTNTGMYWIGADQLGFSTGGSLRWYIDSDGSLVQNSGVFKGPTGSAAAPGYTFAGDPNTGMYQVSADHIGFAAGGVKRFEMPTYANISVGPMWSQGDNPNFALVESDAATDTKIWDMIMVGGTLTFRAVNDAYSAATNWLTVTRSTTTPVAATFNADVILKDAGPSSTLSAGFRGAPRNRQDSSYTLVLGDAGKSIVGYGSTASQVWTIPANSSVTYPIGTTITFINMRSVACSIACTTDTMYFAGSGTTGTRTLAAYSWATALKTDTTNWIIGGTGLT